MAEATWKEDKPEYNYQREKKNYPVVTTNAYREGWERVFGKGAQKHRWQDLVVVDDGNHNITVTYDE